MKTKLTSFLALLLALVVQISFAQDRTISGTVSDKSGPLPGVNILKKGTKIGTDTNFDGKYTINATTGDVLVFSYVGMKTIEKVVGASNTINSTMAEDANILDEVVVTAIGIKRKPRELTASVAQLKSDDLVKTRAVNVTTGIIGKISGMQINTTDSGINPLTTITLRGARSIKGNNEALIVIDGVPSQRGAIDEINSNDVESMTILKGSKSAALYGSDAANGVVVITTKKGKGKLNVTYSTSLEFSSVAYLPEIQEIYGAGDVDGVLDPLESANFGPKYDGRLVNASETLDNGEVWQVPYTPIKNRNRNFFDVGTTIRHDISVGGGDKISDYLFSLGQTNTKGIIPEDTYNKTNIRLKASRTYNKLKVSANVSFFRSHSNTVAGSIYDNLLNIPLHLPLDQMKNWRTGKFTRNEVSFFRDRKNPYYIIDTQRTKSDVNQFNFSTQFNYQINNWLAATLRPSYSFSSTKGRTELGAFTYAFHLANPSKELPSSKAGVSDNLISSSTFNTDFLLTFNNKITEDISTQLILGNNVYMFNSDNISVTGRNLIIPNFYHINTRTGELEGTQSSTKSRKIGVYGDFTLNYKDFLYLNATARNDWSSTLPIQNNSFFYPSIGLSFIPSSAFPEIVSPNGLSYLKTNISWAKTGNDAAPLVANTTFSKPGAFPYGDVVGLSLTANPSDANLKPEFTTSIEAGIEYGLFNNRITGSINAYKTNTTDQILRALSSLSSGAASYLTNIGEMESKGLELDLAATIIKKKDLNWRVSANYTTSSSKVISLFNDADETAFSGLTVAKVGESFPIYKSTAYSRDPNGRVIVGDDGDPLRNPETQYQGKSTPDQILGLTTNLNYKNFNLYIAADYRTGHVFYNTLVNTLEFGGLTQHSTTSGRQPFVFPNSSYSDGNGGYIANTNRLTSSGGIDFWDDYNKVDENYITDASVWKIREIALSYNFDKKLMNNLGITDLTLGVYGRNLLTFRPSDNVYTDPEFRSGSRSTQTPPTKQYGLTLNVKF